MKWQIWRKNLGGFLDPEKTCFLVDVMIATEVSIFGYVISQKVKVEVKKIKDFFLKPTILFHCSRCKHLPWKLVLKHWQTNWAISSSHLNLATWTLFVVLGHSQPTGKGQGYSQAGTFWCVLNVSVRAHGAQLGLDWTELYERKKRDVIYRGAALI